MNKFHLCLILLLACACIFAPASSQESPTIAFTEAENESGIIIDANVTDPDGDLISATLYILEEGSLDVLWTEHRIIQGNASRLSFLWPRRGWSVTNGIDSVGPVIAVNTIDMPPKEAPFLVYSAPCLMEIAPGEQVITALAYFDNEGILHSLSNITGDSYYKSSELLAAISPGESYGRYIKNNITSIAGITTLSFLKLNLKEGLSPLPPLVLDRSPINHYGLQLEGVDMKSVSHVLEVEADDSAGNRVREFSKNMG